MARDRKRAKQRRERRGAAALARVRPPTATQAPPGQTVRSDLPGSLDHAGAEVDEFDAALVAGAGGVPLAPERAGAARAGGPGADGELDGAEPSTEAPPPRTALRAPRRPPGGGGRGDGEGPVGGGGGELAPQRCGNAIAHARRPRDRVPTRQLGRAPAGPVARPPSGSRRRPWS